MPSVEQATIVQICPTSMPLQHRESVVVCLALIELRLSDGRTVREIRPVTGPLISPGGQTERDELDLWAEDDIYYSATAGDGIDRPEVDLLDLDLALDR